MEACMWTSSFRYDKEAKKELDFIVAKLGINKSQAITEAIHLFFKTLKNRDENQKSALEIFSEAGFVGSNEDDTLLSTNYKQRITDYLKEKYDIKPDDTY